MDYYVGLVVSLRSVAVCVVDADDKHVFESTVECEIEDIVRCLEDLPVSKMRIGFESGAMSQHLYYGLRAAGFDVVCMEARQVNAALSVMRNKTDRTDACGIAQPPPPKQLCDVLEGERSWGIGGFRRLSETWPSEVQVSPFEQFRHKARVVRNAHREAI